MVRARCLVRAVHGMVSKVHDIVRTVDLDCDGLVSWDEFKRAFHDPGETLMVVLDVAINARQTCEIQKSKNQSRGDHMLSVGIELVMR